MVGRTSRCRSERTDLLEVGEICLHYRDVGAATSPTVLVLHGLMGHAWEWEVLVGRVGTSHRVIAPDLRGHGFSEWSRDYSIDALATDAIELLEHVGSKEVRLVGHSIGGLAAMLVAARRPDLVSALILVDASPDGLSVPAVAEQLRATLRRRSAETYRSLEEAVAQWADADPSLQRGLVREFLARSFAQDAERRLVWAFDAVGLDELLVDGIEPALLWGAIDDLTAPTLLIRGHGSGMTTRPMVDQMADRLLRFDGLVEIGGASHDLALQAPIAVTHHCAEYLERLVS